MTNAPVLDAVALRRLAEQLEDDDVLCEFLRRYLGMLDQRIDRLERALIAQDREDWMDAVLSLKTSSALAGAQALAAEAALLQEDAQAPPSGASATRDAGTCRSGPMDGLRELAAETARQLRAALQQTARCTTRAT